MSEGYSNYDNVQSVSMKHVKDGFSTVIKTVKYVAGY